MPTSKDKESRGFDYPKGWGKRMDEARAREGLRSVNELFARVMGDYLDESEARAALDVRPAEPKRQKGGGK